MNRFRCFLLSSTMLVTSFSGTLVKADDRAKDGADSATNPPAAATPERESNLRRFWNALKGKGGYPKSRDWTTGRDDAFGKPWLRP